MKGRQSYILLISSMILTTSFCPNQFVASPMTIVIYAELNNLKLNTDKSKEMLVPKSGRWTVPEPPPLGMERVSELKTPGVLFTNDLSVTSHVDDIISKCASTTYALRIMRANGLQDNALFTVCNATTISRLLYAALAWWGI